ncbi:unnamed protein product [Mytilus edulis]|uniref:Peptidase M12B domain-containing protein n=1 Tax=Mytilus edulis TaxID=6550 RepID=A0A8S3S0N5_MYTED|nr:unnamed protein product [Mytilus edulis]
MLMIDSWYDKTPTTDTSQNRESAAKSNLKAYIGSLIKSSNIVYKSLEPNNIFVQIKLVDVIVMTRASDSPWTETVKVRGSPKYRVDPNKVLPLFKPKSVQLQSTIPHDHAMVFTMYALDHGDNHTFSGYAYTDAECKSKSISLVQDNTDFYTAQLMAHELGHSLGCDHDGDGNSCNSKDGYAMATHFILANVKKWTFSSCSVNYIRTYISSLDKQHRDCLLSSQNRHPDPYVLNATTLWYGQRYSADEQCRMHYGADSYLCRDRYYKDYTTICLKLKCYDAKRDSCYYIDGGDGTPCGNKKRFEFLDSCPAGDQTGVVKNGMTCRQLISSDPNECYTHGIKYKCCNLCAGSDQHGNTISIDQQCVKRHGQGSYLCRLIIPRWCVRTLCATTPPGVIGVCHRLLMTEPRVAIKDSCPFGDQSTGIAAHGLTCAQIKHPEHHWRCYDDHTRKKCCETCQSILRNDQGCEYGDKSDWCQTNIASQNDKQMCYWGHNADLCCGSCSKYGNMAHHASNRVISDEFVSVRTESEYEVSTAKNIFENRIQQVVNMEINKVDVSHLDVPIIVPATGESVVKHA